jgi:hypothetical protein
MEAMDTDKLTEDERAALRYFDLFCSAGRPQRPTKDAPGESLIEVSSQALFDVFLKTHPSFGNCRKEILARLPPRVRVHAQWWETASVVSR